MKKFMFLSAVGIAMMFTACSNDDAAPAVDQDSSAVSEISLVLNSGGDGISTRADRPVYSSEAANNVKFVKIAIYNSGGTDVTSTVLVSGISNPLPWTAGPTDAVAPGDNPSPVHKATQTIKLKKISPDGTYTVVVYGYNEETDYTIGGVKNGTLDSFSATPAGAKTAELFAGRSTFTVSGGAIPSNTKCEVELKRHVAGLLGYFKNIPVLYPHPTTGAATAVKYVRVYASAQSTGFTFPSTKLMNGTGTTSGATKVLEFDLASLLSDYAAQVTAAGSDLSVPFSIATQTGNVATPANSLLAGRFLIPFSFVTGATTFTIQLETAENPTNSIVLKKWDVVNEAVGEDEDEEEGQEDLKEKVYSVQRNYFYSIGKKLKANTINGNGATPDQPIDLSKETVIAIIVNDAWDVIYNLGIE